MRKDGLKSLLCSIYLMKYTDCLLLKSSPVLGALYRPDTVLQHFCGFFLLILTTNLYSSFHIIPSGENGGTEKLSNLPKVTQVLSSRTHL